MLKSFISTAKFDYQDPINIDSCLKEEEKIVRYMKLLHLIFLNDLKNDNENSFL